MKQFKVGNYYSCRFPDDKNFILFFKVTGRSGNQITLTDSFGEKFKRRISKALSESNGAECLYPIKRNSNFPILNANNEWQ